MYTSSHELNTPVVDKRICMYNLKFLCLCENDDRLKVSYPTDKKSAGFRFNLETSRVSSPLKSTDTTKQSVSGWLYNIYITCGK